MPTPLGNLRDITLRALDALRDCDAIVAEDTRVARKLLRLLELPTKPIVGYREQNAAAVTTAILERATSESLVVVSDAGMPGISDPGSALVAAARAAGIAIEVLPGPTAFVCAAVLSGFDLARLEFAGFFPRTEGARTTALRTALERSATTVWYESPQRLERTLETFARDAPHARIFVARELTKLYEQQLLGIAQEILDALARPIRGEIVFVLDAASAARRIPATTADIDREIDEALASGASVAAIAKDLAKRKRGERASLYVRVAERKRMQGRP